MTTQQPIRLTCDTCTIEVPAIVHGNWAAHGKIDGDYRPSSTSWTVSYVPSGLALPHSLSGWLIEQDAIAIAAELHAAIPELSDVGEETERRIVEVVERAMRIRR